MKPASAIGPADQADTYPITGIKDGISSDTVPVRVEVDSWYPPTTETQARQVNLFILALRIFQDMDPEEKLSYFQIAGIHGSPYMPWDEEADAQNSNEGYCFHDSLLFPCWHRPYLLLFEQRLYEIMVEKVIPQYPRQLQDDFKAAAATFRLPYWDWAQKKTESGKRKAQYDVPEIAKKQKIAVLGFDGTTTSEVDNPMYKFTMPAHERMGRSGIADVPDQTPQGKFIAIPFSKSRGTSRWAPLEPESRNVSAAWQEGEVDNDKIAAALNNRDAAPNPLAEMVYRLFLPDYIKTFDQFATTKYTGPKPTSYLSVESIHNYIHSWTGGFGAYMGHMAEVPVSAFDPIFWMHHCNVDRLFAIWQALNVGNTSNWFERPDEQLPDDGNRSVQPGTIDTPKTRLAPFHTDTKGTYFTSDDVRDWMKLGYSYPELQPWLDKYKENGKFDKDLYARDIKEQLKSLYRPGEAAISNKDHFINVAHKRFALNGVPYTIHFFMGDVEKEYTGPLHAHEAHVGAVYNFSTPIYKNPASPSCQNCRRKANQGTDSTAQIPITAALIARVKAQHLESLEEDHVEEYLKKNLYWKVQTNGGYEVPISEDDPFIKVSVLAGIAEHYPEEHKLSRYFSHKTLSKATGGKRGGF